MGAFCRSITVLLVVPTAGVIAGCAGAGSPERPSGPGVPAALASIRVVAEAAALSRAVSEAPTGMDTTTNGFASQADMDAARDHFEEIELIADGLGPIYNAQSCRECHQNPVTGGGSQITEFR